MQLELLLKLLVRALEILALVSRDAGILRPKIRGQKYRQQQRRRAYRTPFADEHRALP